MAIDTAAKRASALGVGLAFVLAVIPDGSIDQPDRQTIANSYGGVLTVVDTQDCFISLNGLINDNPASFESFIADTPVSVTGTIEDSIGLSSSLCD